MGHGGAYVTEVAPDVEARRRAVKDAQWTWLRQVHGDTVVTVTAPADGAGSKADASVTDRADCVLAVLTADCAPVALVGTGGVVGAVHAGWRGLSAGVIERAVDAARALGATDLRAVLGPCIRPECYEFGAADLDAVAAALGDGVRAVTAAGRPALDVPSAVAAALERAGVTQLEDLGACTACSDDYFSWRARGELARQAMVVWRD
ncbi:MAG: polyphenol oxidase family protein [Acidimicrobiia bacterium]|nr:polyphenol oxidase family protein [Acidimicrobiia bacterium]